MNRLIVNKSGEAATLMLIAEDGSPTPSVLGEWRLHGSLAACLPPLLHACCTQEAVDVMAAALAQEGPI